MNNYNGPDINDMLYGIRQAIRQYHRINESDMDEKKFIYSSIKSDIDSVYDKLSNNDEDHKEWIEEVKELIEELGPEPTFKTNSNEGATTMDGGKKSRKASRKGKKTYKKTRKAHKKATRKAHKKATRKGKKAYKKAKKATRKH